jgi:type II secretory pathway component PulL
MAISDRRHRIAKLLWRRLRILITLALVVLAVSGVWNIYKKERESKALRTDSERQLEALVQQQKALTDNIGTLQTARGKEAALRDQYAVGKPGEQLVVIVEPERSATTTEQTGFLQMVHKFLPFW